MEVLDLCLEVFKLCFLVGDGAKVLLLFDVEFSATAVLLFEELLVFSLEVLNTSL